MSASSYRRASASIVDPGVAPIVAIDARMVGPKLHGIARYVTEMAKGLLALRESASLAYEPVFILHADCVGSVPAVFSKFRHFVARSTFLHPKEILELPKILKKGAVRLYHSPSFSSLLYAPCPWVVTVHDLNHLYYGGIVGKAYYRLFLKNFARRASRLLTVSEFSQKELAAWLGFPEDRIEVVLNALDPAFAEPLSSVDLESVLARFGLKHQKYFFCLSNPKPHKNVALLVEAYRAFRGQCREASPLVLSMSEFRNHSGVLSLGSLREDEARALLCGARAVFFPSLYEGFGLPPLEASAVGTPLAVSDIPPHREALRSLLPEEALWIAPLDFHGWVQGFHRAQRGELAPASPESRNKILLRYGPDQLGQKMNSIYIKILSSMRAIQDVPEGARLT